VTNLTGFKNLSGLGTESKKAPWRYALGLFLCEKTKMLMTS